MNSNQLANGPTPEQPSQEEIDKWASRTAWKWILGGIGCVAIYNISRGIANNLNRAMGGTPHQLSSLDDDES